MKRIRNLLVIFTFSSVLMSLFLMVSCKKSISQQEAEPEDMSYNFANCGGKRIFLFGHYGVEYPANSGNRAWICWYSASTTHLFGTPTSEETFELFLKSKPLHSKYISADSLVKRLASLDQGRTTLLWLTSAAAIAGCAVVTGATMGVGSAACALVAASPALYDVFGGDPSIGAAEAWRKLAEQKADTLAFMECNAMAAIAAESQLINSGKGKQNISNLLCPTPEQIIKKEKKLHIEGKQFSPADFVRLQKK